MKTINDLTIQIQLRVNVYKKRFQRIFHRFIMCVYVYAYINTCINAFSSDYCCYLTQYYVVCIHACEILLILFSIIKEFICFFRNNFTLIGKFNRKFEVIDQD